MKITNRINKIEGVYNSYWNGTNRSLSVYLKENTELDKIKIMISKTLGDIGLWEAVERINFYSFN